MKNKLLYVLTVAAVISLMFGAVVVVNAGEIDGQSVAMQNSMMQMMSSMKEMMGSMENMNEHCSKMMNGMMSNDMSNGGMSNMMEGSGMHGMEDHLSHHNSHHGGD